MFDNEWGGATAYQKIGGVGMWGPWVMNNPYKLDGMEPQGNAECVAIAQATLRMPHTSFWRPGVKVLGNGEDRYVDGIRIHGSGIAPGTVIATFIDGIYPSKRSGNHVAIYISQTKDTIKVIDQWMDHKRKAPKYPGYRTLPTGGSGLSNDANAFSVVYTLKEGY